MRKSADRQTQMLQKEQESKSLAKLIVILPFLGALFCFVMFFDFFGLQTQKEIYSTTTDLKLVPDTQEVYLPKFEIPKKDKLYFIEMSADLFRGIRNDVFVMLELCDTLQRPFQQIKGDFYYDFGFDWSEYVNSVYEYMKSDTTGYFAPRIVVEKTPQFNLVNESRESCMLKVKVVEQSAIFEYYLWAMGIFLILGFAVLTIFGDKLSGK